MCEKRMLILERALSSLSGYDGWMLGSVAFFFDQKDRNVDMAECQLQVMHKRERFVKVEIVCLETKDRLLVLLIDSEREMKNRNKVQDFTSVCTEDTKEKFMVTRKETDRYLGLSGDKNPIHTGNLAIVPGFLMVNRLAAQQKDAYAAIEARFYHPLYIGEFARLVERKETKYRSVDLFQDQRRILQIKFYDRD